MEWKKLRTKLMIWNIRKKKTFNQNSKNKKENKDRLRSLQDNCRNGKRKQEIENLFEKIMKENFPNLVKEIDIQVQEAQRVPNKMDTKRTAARNITIKMAINSQLSTTESKK